QFASRGVSHVPVQRGPPAQAGITPSGTPRPARPAVACADAEDRGACTPSGHLVHLSPVLVHTVHDREYERRRPADQDDTREALDPCQHAPARAENDVAEADRRVGGDGEVDRRLQRRALARSPEHDGPESDLDQMKEDDAYEEGDEKPDAATHVWG